jgi:hypothetical protein
MTEPSAHPDSTSRVIPIAAAGTASAPTAAMIRTLGLVSAICGLIIVGAPTTRSPPINASPPSARCSR